MAGLAFDGGEGSRPRQSGAHRRPRRKNPAHRRFRKNPACLPLPQPKAECPQPNCLAGNFPVVCSTKFRISFENALAHRFQLQNRTFNYISFLPKKFFPPVSQFRLFSLFMSFVERLINDKDVSTFGFDILDTFPVQHSP